MSSICGAGPAYSQSLDWSESPSLKAATSKLHDAIVFFTLRNVILVLLVEIEAGNVMGVVCIGNPKQFLTATKRIEAFSLTEQILIPEVAQELHIMKESIVLTE